MISRPSRQEISDLRSVIHAMYRASYRDPPWNETEDDMAQFEETFAHIIDRPDLEIVAAFGPDAELLGLTYGWPTPRSFPAGHGFYDAVVDGLGRGVVDEEILTTTFEVVELMVAPTARRRGLGRSLLDGVVANRSAWLSTHPEAPATRLYESAGWRQVGGYRAFDTDLVVYVTSRHGHSTA